MEREPTTQKIVERIDTLVPQRVFLDGMTQFRYLCADDFQFHKQALSFLRFLTDRGITVLLSSESSTMAPDDDLQFLSDGVLCLESAPHGRYLQVTKYRGSGFHDGRHALRLTNHGMEVYPRLMAEQHRRKFVVETISSGVPELDELLQGGLERGTITIITGPSGVGKTTLGLYFMKEAAGRGERSVVYSFEERVDTLLHRSEAVNIPVRDMIQHGTLSVVQVEPLQYSPEEFWGLVRHEVEQRAARIVMLDSITGYRLCMPEQNLMSNVHGLCTYLRNMGATGILVNEIESITGVFRATEVGISYLMDNIIFLRYLEMRGELRRAIGVLKKRLGSFERSMREFELTRYGLKVGEPLTALRGVLSGEPEWAEPHGNRAGGNG